MRLILVVIGLMLLWSVASATDYVDSFSMATQTYFDGRMRSAAVSTSYETGDTIFVVSVGTAASYTAVNTGYMSWESIVTSIAAGRTIDSARLYTWVWERTNNFGLGNAILLAYRSMQYMATGQVTWNECYGGCLWATAGAQNSANGCVEQACDGGSDIPPATGCGTAYAAISSYTAGQYNSFLISNAAQRWYALTSSELGLIFRVANTEQNGVYDTIKIASEESAHPPYLKVWSHTVDGVFKRYFYTPVSRVWEYTPAGKAWRHKP